MISFLGTDAHKSDRYYPRVREAIEKIISITGEEKFEELSNLNPEAVLENKELDTVEYFPIEKNFFGKYK